MSRSLFCKWGGGRDQTWIILMKFTQISKFARNEAGATMVEYGVAVVLAVLVGTSGLVLLGNQVNNNLNAAATEMADTDEN